MYLLNDIVAAATQSVKPCNNIANPSFDLNDGVPITVDVRTSDGIEIISRIAALSPRTAQKGSPLLARFSSAFYHKFSEIVNWSYPFLRHGVRGWLCPCARFWIRPHGRERFLLNCDIYKWGRKSGRRESTRRRSCELGPERAWPTPWRCGPLLAGQAPLSPNRHLEDRSIGSWYGLAVTIPIKPHLGSFQTDWQEGKTGYKTGGCRKSPKMSGKCDRDLKRSKADLLAKATQGFVGVGLWVGCVGFADRSFGCRSILHCHLRITPGGVGSNAREHLSSPLLHALSKNDATGRG